MGTIELTKVIFSKYYPKQHFLLAILLSTILASAGLFTSVKTAQESNTLLSTAVDLPTSSPNSTSEADDSTLPEPISNTLANTLTTEKGTETIAPQSKLAVLTHGKEVKVRRGDNLSTLFSKVGLKAQDLYQLLQSCPDSKLLRRLYPGNTLVFDISAQGQLNQLKLIQNPLVSYQFTRSNGRFESSYIERTPEIRNTYKRAVIDNSLFVAGQQAKISPRITMETANAFGGVIDFMLETRKGDSFSVLFEEKYLDGEFFANGEILAAQFTNQGKTHTALRYVDENGDVGYYNPDGVSMRNAFLRNPLDIVRISSSFSLRRKHPVLNTIRVHKGTDYAAPRGTPIQATGDGRVTYATRNGSFGKLVVVQHGQQYVTKYAHLSRYGRGIRKGAKIKQGQVVGYVGTTGSATGPHLHYEFLVNGVHRNPRTILKKLPKAKSIASHELARFHRHTGPLLNQLSSYSQAKLLTYNGAFEL